MDIAETRGTPAALDVFLRVRRVEALDAAAQEGADARPALGDRAADERQPHPRVEAPQGSKQRVGRHAEVERRDASARADDTRKLAHHRGRVIDVPKQIGECQVVERPVRER